MWYGIGLSCVWLNLADGIQGCALNKEFYKKPVSQVQEVTFCLYLTGWTKHFEAETIHLDEFFCQVRSGNSYRYLFLGFTVRFMMGAYRPA